MTRDEAKYVLLTAISDTEHLGATDEFLNACNQAIEVLEKLPPTTWRDISSAPIFQPPFNVVIDGKVCFCLYREIKEYGISRWMVIIPDEPKKKSWILDTLYEKATHWQPLPLAPNQEQGGCEDDLRQFLEWILENTYITVSAFDEEDLEPERIQSYIRQVVGEWKTKDIRIYTTTEEA